MSDDTENTEAPNWLNELEAKRERRLKVRLGHEAGAGAPCLTCNDKCPGLDLHFWRKICKNCKCSKENHDVHDDDIYGWAQFQLLGNKVTKIKKKIVLPGKKDEVELEWTPKGQTETIDRYLKTLPPETLPVKGSKAAQTRKQMLQKQIPIHDLDPGLCHDLSEVEKVKMRHYIDQVKSENVGVGQVVELGSVLLRDRYPMGGPAAIETVTRQGENMAEPLSKQLERMNLLNDPRSRTLHIEDPNRLSPANVTSGNQDLYRGDMLIRDRMYPFNATTEEQQLNAFFDTVPNPMNMTAATGEYNANTLYRRHDDNNRSLSSVPLSGAHHQQGYDESVVGSLDPQHRLRRPDLPRYAPGTYQAYAADLQKNPASSASSQIGNVRDLAFSTYDLARPNNAPPTSTLVNPEFPLPPPPPPSVSEDDVTNSNYGGNSSLPLPPPPPLSQHPYDRTLIGGHIPGDTGRRMQQQQQMPLGNLQNYSARNAPAPLVNNLSPEQVNIGIIQDINATYPQEIKSALLKHRDITSGPFYEPSAPSLVNNQRELKTCKKCNKSFSEGDFAIFVERSGALYHSECFKCAGCNQSLADMVYFYDKEMDDIYCGRDFAKIRGVPRCKACDELIFVKEYCLAENSTFHIKHFCCFSCDNALVGKDYVIEDQQPFCLPCYEKEKANRCEACAGVIKPHEQGVSLNGVHFHNTDECFACVGCGISLLGGRKMLLRDRKLFCSRECYDRKTTRR